MTPDPLSTIAKYLMSALALGGGTWALAFYAPFLTDSNKGKFIAICLVVIEAIFGFLDPKRGALWGAATGLPIVVFTILVALFVEPEKHNLFDIELFLAFIFMLPAIAGALLGKLIKKFFLHQAKEGKGPG